ncbi:MAG: cytochrome c biogenesis protein CcsA [candidate division NC10 bacterium]|nr:cytochrome c biogenesis protein CcsA [candidate division NC10 bacterium]
MGIDERDKFRKWLAPALFLSMLAALYAAFVYAPTEATQGDVQRIFYFHVPSAWVAFLAFFVVFLGSILYLWKKDRRWDILASSSAEIGVLFTTMVLLTGPLWGKPIWGTYWSWDPRLTTTLILWLIYVAYFMLRAYAGERVKGARMAAVLGIIGFVDVPLIYLSVLWWRSLHPLPVVVRPGGPALPPSMLGSLMVSLLAFTLLYLYLLRERVLLERLNDEVEALKQKRR